MAKSARSIGASPGPVADDTQCQHGGGVSGFSLPIDPGLDYLVACGRDATFRAPFPSETGIIGTRALCPFHLARFLAAFPEAGARLHARFNLGARVPEHEFIRLSDAPCELDHYQPRDWQVLALDQVGRAHYHSRSMAAIRVLDSEFITAVDPLDERSFAGYMEQVRETVGWAEFADLVRHPLGGDRA